MTIPKAALVLWEFFNISISFHFANYAVVVNVLWLADRVVASVMQGLYTYATFELCQRTQVDNVVRGLSLTV